MLLKRWVHDSCHARCCCCELSFDVAGGHGGCGLWHLRRGKPRRPLRIWQWWWRYCCPSPLLRPAQIAWIDQRQAQQMAEQELLTHITLGQSVVRGGIILSAGSHIQRYA
jgi:hypothetical protein